jgi:predicted nucleotidyltransferase
MLMTKVLKPSPPTLDAVTTLLVPILATHDIEKAILFGSVARRTADRRSDVDLLIVKRTDARFFDRYE